MAELFEFISADVIRYILELVVFIPKTREELDIALKQWFGQQKKAKLIYGEIGY